MSVCSVMEAKPVPFTKFFRLARQGSRDLHDVVPPSEVLDV
jgi:hypothetical protein